MRSTGIGLGLWLTLGLLGCGGGAPPEGMTATATSTSFSGSCCLNGSFYACGSQAAFDRCSGGDPAACHAACGADFACHMQCDAAAQKATHDPSQSTRTVARDGDRAPTGGG